MKNRSSIRRHAFSIAAMLLAAQAAAATVSFEQALRLKNEQQLPAATEAFAALAAAQPNDPKPLEQLATVLAWQNRFEDSIAAWQKAIALDARNPAYHVGLARTRYWQGEEAQALQAVDTALRLAPDDAEALKLRSDVLKAQAASHTASLRWRLDAGATYDHYDNFRGSENSRYVQLGRRVGAGNDVLYARYDGYDNFGSIDQSLTLGSYWLPHPRLLLNLEAGRTFGTANFRPKTLAQGNVELLLDGPLQPLLALRYFDYEDGGVTTVAPGVRALLPGSEIEVRYGITDNIDGSTTGVFAVRATLRRSPFAPYVAFTKGSEALPPQAKAKITVLGAGVVWDVSAAWALRADYAYEDRRNIYKHHAIGVGLSHRF